ncbi:MAG: bifunctional aspartate kinase/homoserine dehydrogenase I, partial [Maribacter sp.]|nr:bifunctional aspartate kinase/homoserine dehydrogenase I [Maribacter sp.]
MKVLKFGGTSVANAENITLVKNIVSKTESDKAIVVVSAFGGITDLLLNTASLASLQDDSYKSFLKEIEDRHLATIKKLISIKAQSRVLSKVKSELNTLETLLEGAFLIGEITPKLSDKIVSYGELLSSYIISEFFAEAGLDVVHKDSRELIKTNNVNGKAAVNFKLTDHLCTDFIANTPHKIIVLAGFIASAENGGSTTLGRGGSDYTAAIVAAALNADLLEIWTDVSGMYTANPRL